MPQKFEYKGYFFGKIELINDLVTFEGKSKS